MATTLCKKLKLSIELENVEGGEEQIHLKLQNDLTLSEVNVWYPVGANTKNRRYHRQEALVIGMRRLIDQALKDGLITVSLGAFLDLNSGPAWVSPIVSSTELGL